MERVIENLGAEEVSEPYNETILLTLRNLRSEEAADED